MTNVISGYKLAANVKIHEGNMTGNMYGLYRQDGQERQPEDYYATHPSAIPPLMKILGWENGDKKIWEPCAGGGHLSQMMELYGHQVVSTDLVDRGYGVGGVDFLTDTVYDHMDFDAIITNPPYSLCLPIVEKSVRIAPIACHFLNIRFLESSKRRKFFEEFPPRYVAVFSERIPSSKNGLFPKGESSAVCYAWFIWFKGFKGKPEILWI